MIRNIKEQRFKKITTVVSSVRMCIKTFAYVIILSSVMTSCTSEDEFSALPDAATALSSAPVDINFTVSTRATGDDTTVETANETEIKADDTNGKNYRIYLFDNTNHKYLCSITPQSFSSSNDNGNTKYSVSGKIDADSINYINSQTNGNFTVVFIANWNEYPAYLTHETTIDDLCTGNAGGGFDATFDCPTSLTTETLQKLYMPFYGVKQFTSNFLSNSSVDFGEIKLLRAMAKVTVVNVSETQTRAVYYPDLTDVKLVHYNSKGYCAPYQIYNSDIGTNGYQTDTDGNYYVNDLHLTGANNTTNDDQSTGHDAISMYQTNDSTWIAYIPEFYNSGTSQTDTCYVQYNVKCEKLKDGVSSASSDNDYVYNYTDKYSSYNNSTLSFAEYTDGVLADNTHRYDIKRNKSYRFEVSLPKILNVGAVDDNVGDTENWYVKRKYAPNVAK